MDLEAEILREHSKRQSMKIAAWIGNSPQRFAGLMELFLHGEYRITQRSAWVVSHCVENHPGLVTPWLSAMIKKMEEPGVHDAVKRNTVRILENVSLPRPLLGRIASICFEYLTAVDAPIAVKVHAMTVLENIGKQKPDLNRELEMVIRHMLPFAGAAIRARGRMVLSHLSKK